MVALPEDLVDGAGGSGTGTDGRLLAGRDVTFLPDDPPRAGRFVVYDPALDSPALGDSGATGARVELVLPRGKGVRRRSVPARLLTVAEALPFLLDPGEEGGVTPPRPSVLAWSAAMTFGLGLLARGRLVPAVTTSGWDAWRIGPFDRDDHRTLGQLARAFPAAAHALRLEFVAEPAPTVDSGEDTTDIGVVATAAWARSPDPLPRIPSPPPAPGHPTVLAVDPPPGHGVQAEALRALAADAARRAWALAVGLRPAPLEATLDHDLEDLGGAGG